MVSVHARLKGVMCIEVVCVVSRLLFFLFLVSFQSEACQTTIDEEQREILIHLMRVDSEFSKDLHVKFWAPMEDCSNEEKGDIAQQFSAIPSLSVAQNAQWLSIKKSVERKEITFDPSYEDFLLIRKEWLESRGMPLDKLEAEKARLIDIIESILESGSMRVDGVDVVIDIEIINQILEGIEASQQRLKMLLSIPEL